MESEQLRKYVIAPTLLAIGLDSLAAQNLLLGTCAQESQMGRFLVQVGGGPARGIFQMEPTTEADVWNNFLNFRSKLADLVRSLLVPRQARVDQLVWNLAYATAMCRVLYLRSPLPLPASDDIPGLARIWKLAYNTPSGAGTEIEFAANYRKYVR